MDTLLRTLGCAHATAREGDEPVSHHLAGMPATEEDRWRIIQARRLDQSLHTSQALVRAFRKLHSKSPIACEPQRLGIVLASERGDQAALVRRMREFAVTREQSGKAEPDLFRSISYFPVGRVIKTLGDTVGCLGPRVSVSGGRSAAIAVAECLLKSGRAEQILLAQAEISEDAQGAEASLELLGNGTPAIPTMRLAVVATASCPQEHGHTCAGLLRSTLDMLSAHTFANDTALIVCSMLGNAGELLYAQVAPRDPGPSLEESLREIAANKGFGQCYTFVGSSGGAMVGLALAHDLIALGRARKVVVCGVDLVEGALSGALQLLRCPDLPHMSGGAVALVLQPSGADHRPGLVEIGDIKLGASEARKNQAPYTIATEPRSIVLSGLNSLDLQNAELAAETQWPGITRYNRGQERHVGGDVLELVCRYSSMKLPAVIVAAHGLGGDGEFVLYAA